MISTAKETVTFLEVSFNKCPFYIIRKYVFLELYSEYLLLHIQLLLRDFYFCQVYTTLNNRLYEILRLDIYHQVLFPLLATKEHL